MKKLLAIIMVIVIAFTSVGNVMAAKDNGTSDKISSANTVVAVLYEVFHSVIGNVFSKFEKECPLCRSCHEPARVAEPESNCRLIVNGEDITEGRYVKIDEENQTFQIPIIAVYEALGAKIKRIGNLVIISYNGGVATIDLSQRSFGLLVPPGTVGGIRVVSAEDAIMESDSFGYYFVRTMKGVEYNVDYDSKVIYINSVE